MSDKFSINSVSGSDATNSGPRVKKMDPVDPYKVSTFGTKIVKQEPETPQVKSDFMNAGQFSAYFGNKAQKANQNQYSDLKSNITKQQQLITDAGGTPPPIPSAEDFSANKKGADAYLDALREYNNSLTYEVQLAQTQDVNSSISDAANEIIAHNDMNTMGLHGHISAEGEQTRVEGFSQYVDLKGDIEKVDQNVDEEGAATRRTVNAAAQRTVGAVQKSHQDLKATVIGEGRSTRNTVTNGTRQVISNNNEQTKILDPSGTRRGLHELDEWLFGD